MVLQPMVTQLDSFVLDTSHLLREMNGLTLDSDCILVGLDVEALYMSIPHSLGLKYINLSISLSLNNIISFCMLWTLSCITMFFYLTLGEWERHVFSADEYEMHLCHILRWHRYIDYIMLIWQGSEQLLKEFVTKLNTNSFNLSFIINCDSSRLEFLEIEIKKNHEGLLSTNLHQKKTCIEGIPKGQYLKLRRICSSDEDFKQEAYKLYQRFKTSGYKTETLHRAYQWAVAQNREDLLYKANGTCKISTNTKTQTRLIMTYNKNYRDIRFLIHKHWYILSKDPILSKLVTPHPSFTYRRNTSIGDLLTHSHFQKQSRQTCCKMPGSYRCGSCEQCLHMKPSNTFGRDGSGMTCITIFAAPRHILYVGKTKRPLKRHIYEHLLDIRNCNLLSSIAKHIYCMHKGNYTGSYFQGIDRLHGDLRGGDLDNKLLQLETTWIFRLNTYKMAFGLNGHLNFQAFVNK
ncbi:hypothetical protein XELAEV_18033337mg [Xenopus laevis]|uniref:GIY-YIG domain-containing protein n=1 Tax=Xenopus laevis TaxID=8355 RepID=A0A974CJD9_XENLA|nr:hypothetical protein XELAEV_18033337mg [Xenopus laevis]